MLIPPLKLLPCLPAAPVRCRPWLHARQGSVVKEFSGRRGAPTAYRVTHPYNVMMRVVAQELNLSEQVNFASVKALAARDSCPIWSALL